MIHCQFLGSVFRGRTPITQNDSNLRRPIVSANLLGSNPHNLNIIHRSSPSSISSNAPIIAPKKRRNPTPLVKSQPPPKTEYFDDYISIYDFNLLNQNNTLQSSTQRRRKTMTSKTNRRFFELPSRSKTQNSQNTNDILGDYEMTEPSHKANRLNQNQIDHNSNIQNHNELNSIQNSDEFNVIQNDEEELNSNQNDFFNNNDSQQKIQVSNENNEIDYSNLMTVKQGSPSNQKFEEITRILDQLNDPSTDSSLKEDGDLLINHIFGEVVHDYFVECGSQGEVLEKCRQNFIEAQEKIPKVSAHYQNQLKKRTDQVHDLAKRNQTTRPEISHNKEKSDYLTKVIQEMKEELQRLIRHNDQLVNSITITTNETIQMKKEIEQLDLKIGNQNQLLIDLNEELQKLSELSSQYTTDSVSFAEKIKILRERQKEAQKECENSNTQLRSLVQKVSRMDTELIELKNENEAKSGRYIKKVPIETQIDLISRRVFRANQDHSNQSEKQSTSANSQEKPNPQNLEEKIKTEFLKAVGKKADEDFEITSYEDFAKLKIIMLNNEDSFHLQTEEVEDAQNGDFTLDSDNPSIDYIRLLASRISMDVVDQAIHTFPKVQKTTQTFSPKLIYKDETANKPKELRKKSLSRFSKLIPTDFSSRKPQPFHWLVNTIRTLYHEKELVNNQSFLNNEPLVDFSTTIWSYAQKKYELPFLRDQFCWDIEITAPERKNSSLEVDTFVNFLDNKYDNQQLAFYLLCRKDCIKFGSSVQVKTIDQLDTYTEFYLTLAQIESLLPKWWKDHYHRGLYNKMVEYSIARPAVHLEATARYVSMSDLLMQTICDYSDNQIKRISDLLSTYRIAPRLKMNEFNKFLRSMVQDISQSQISEFYKTTVSNSSKEKPQITVNDFIELFHKGSVLNSIEAIPNEAEKVNKEMVETIQKEFEKNSGQLDDIFDHFKQLSKKNPDNLSLKANVDNVSRIQILLSQSFSTGDGRMCSLLYFQYICAIDLLFSSLDAFENLDEETSIRALESDLKEKWIESSF